MARGRGKLPHVLRSESIANKTQDDRLEQAVKEIDAKIDSEIAKLREKKWLQVASHVADLIQKKKYTARLCHERYDSLMDGTALKPIELDSDQEGRAEMRNSRIANNRRLRKEAAAAAQIQEEQKKAALIAKKEAQASNKVIKITRAQKKKIETEKIANMKKAALAQIKAQKTIVAQWAAYNKVESLWLSRKKKIETKLLNKMLGLPASYRRSRANNADGEGEDEGEMTDRITDEELEMEDDDVFAEAEPDIDNLDNVTTAQSGKHGRESDAGSDKSAPLKKRLRHSSGSKFMSPKHVGVGEAEVNDDTRANPRSVMTLAELNTVLARRDLPRSSSEESQEQVVARLHMEDKTATVSTLTAALKASGLETRGDKQTKINRLQAYDVSRSVAGEQT